MLEMISKVTEKELKRHYDLKVKAAISKKTTADTTALEKTKTFDEINWSTRVSSNTLDKLYVSQLHLYLVQQIGMSKTQCQAKGYTKAKKIEDIKKHFYSSSKQSNAGNLQSSLSRKPFSTLISLPRTV